MLIGLLHIQYFPVSVTLKVWDLIAFHLWWVWEKMIHVCCLYLPSDVSFNKKNLYQRLFTIDTDKPVLQRLCKWLGKMLDGNFCSVVWPFTSYWQFNRQNLTRIWRDDISKVAMKICTRKALFPLGISVENFGLSPKCSGRSSQNSLIVYILNEISTNFKEFSGRTPKQHTVIEPDDVTM